MKYISERLLALQEMRKIAAKHLTEALPLIEEKKEEEELKILKKYIHRKRKMNLRGTYKRK